MRFSKQAWAIILFVSLIHGVFYVKDNVGNQPQSSMIGAVIGAALSTLVLPAVITYLVIGIGQLIKRPPSQTTRYIVFLIFWGFSILALQMSR